MSNDDNPPASDSPKQVDDPATLVSELQAETAAAPGEPSGDQSDDAESAPGPSAEQAAAAPRDGVSRFLATLSLLVALGAAAGAGFLFWQYRQFYVALNEADAGAQAALERTRADLRDVRDEIQRLADEQQTAQRELAAQRAEVQSLPRRFVALEERLATLQGVSADARRRWLRSEAEYLLGVANVELALAGRFEGAVAALELADSKLRELGNPGFSPVREAIAQALQRLGAVALPDVEGLSLTIGSLARSVEQMPLIARPPDVYDPVAAEPDDLEPGLERAWASLKSALQGMISIERRAEPVARQVSGEQERLIRRTLELELSSARLALLREQGELYRQSLSAARDALIRYFDSADAQVTSALALLEELLLVDVEPVRPDISASLRLLRQLSSQQDDAQ